MAETNEEQVVKKVVQPCYITICFCKYKPYSKYGQPQQDFSKVLMLYIAKGYRPLSFVENPWL
jgi:hypothetical protein